MNRINQAARSLGLAILAIADITGPALAGSVENPDLRVARLGEGLAVAAAPLCPAPVARVGIDLHSRSQYGSMSADQAGAEFPASTGTAILLVVPGSAADQAGVRAGQGLLSIDGVPIDQARSTSGPSYAQTRLALDQLDAALSDGVAELLLRRADGSDLHVRLNGTPGCPTRFQMTPRGGIEARADGTYVQVGQRMVESADSDDVLAASLAHELAHNLLRHRERQNAQGMRRGIARMFGRSAALSRASEMEADRMVPWLLALAGHDPAAGLRWIDLIERLAGPAAPTHPGWNRRRQIISVQLPLIATQQAAGQPLRPPFDVTGAQPLSPDEG